MLMLSALRFIVFGGVILFCMVKGRIFNRCEFGYELQKKGINASNWTHEIPKWLCLGDHLTKYDTTWYSESDDRNSYGILRISNHWCNDTHAHSNDTCKVPCRELLQNNITATVNCANIIFAAENFNAWAPFWENNCRDIDASNYTAGCQENIGNRPVVVLKEGDTNAVVSCSVRGYPGMINMTWDWDTKETDIDSGDIEEPIFDPIPVDIDYYHNLTFNAVKLEHTKQYICHADNGEEQLSTVFHIEVVKEATTDMTSTTVVSDSTPGDATSDTSSTEAIKTTYTTTDPITTFSTSVSGDTEASTNPSTPNQTDDPSITYETTESGGTDRTGDPGNTNPGTDPSNTNGTENTSTTDDTTNRDTTYRTEDPGITDGSTDSGTTDGTQEPGITEETTGQSSTERTEDPDVSQTTTTTDSVTYSSSTDVTGDPGTTHATTDPGSSDGTVNTDITETTTDPSTTDQTEHSDISDTTGDPNPTDGTGDPIGTDASTHSPTSDETEHPGTTDATTDINTTDGTENPGISGGTTDSTTSDGTEDPGVTYPTTDLSSTDRTDDPGLTDSTTDSSTTDDPGSSESTTKHSTTEGPEISADTTLNTTTQLTTTHRPIVSTSTMPPEGDIVYEFCDLAKQLTYLFDDNENWNDDLHTWMCLSETATSLNGSYVGLNPLSESTIIYYGLFKINNTWCNDVFNRQSPCHTKCEDLVGTDLIANAFCAKTIEETGGFDEWSEYQYCSDYTRDKLNDCLEAPKFISAEEGEVSIIFEELEKGKNITSVARGYPPPELFWDEATREYIQQSGGRVRLIGSTKEKLNGTWTVQNTIFFETVEKSDERTYRCNATNSVASANQNNNVKVLVKEAQWKRQLMIAGGSLLALLALLAIILAYIWYRLQKKKDEKLREIYERFKYGNQTGNEMGSDAPGSDYFSTSAEFQTYQRILDLPFPKALEILPHQLNVLRSNILGVGAFGIVYKGELGGRKEVAVKTVFDWANEEQLSSLLSEVKIMSFVGSHPNIVQLLGVQMVDLRRGIVYVALEYCSQGSLKSLLQQKRIELERNSRPTYNYNVEGYLSPQTYVKSTPFSVYQLLKFCHQVSTAMEFLTSKNIVHGDLAARNVLVDANFVAKISDFGLSRQMSDTYKKYIVAPKETSLPWRWLAIETLRDLKFSSESDVWAFGVFMWEVFSLAELPYGTSISFSQDFVNYLEGGFRLQIPKFATQEIHELMKQCWEKDVLDRVKFQEMSGQLLRLIQVEYGTGSRGYRRRGYYLQPF